jgi:hypothetical protein
MDTRSISPKALDMIKQYKEFSLGNSVISLPYFNNKTTLKRAALRVEVGKGNPEEILNEVKELAIKNRVDYKNLNESELKKFLVDHGIGIDCSGFVYHILNIESQARNKGEIKDNLKFSDRTGILDKIRAKIRPAENTSVKIFANNENSRVVELRDVKPADIITLVGDEEGLMRDHILLIYKIDYENNLPKTIFYAHSIAWPTDGEYSHGVSIGRIEILDINKNIRDQSWIEKEKKDFDNYTFTKAKKSLTEIRRLNWF